MAVFMAASDAGHDYLEAEAIAHDTSVLAITQLEGELVSIDTIQETVENVLMSSCWKDVARKYIEYRHDRSLARELNNNLHKNIHGLISQTDQELLNENANKQGKQFHVQRDLVAGEVAKHYALEYILPRNLAKAHKKGDLHIHDLDYNPFMGMTNCCLVNLTDMLTNGFKMGNAEVESPNGIRTAATVVTQIAMGVASEQYGGTSFNRLDEVLEPFVYKTYDKELAKAREEFRFYVGEYPMSADEMYRTEKAAMERTVKHVEDACQTMEYQVNTMYTTNGQTPFLTFGFGLGTGWGAKLVQEGILKTRIAGLGKRGTTPIFPKLVFAIKDGVNHKDGDPNYHIKRLALKCASLRMYPDILNYDKLVEITGGFKTPMGCRSFLGYKENEKGEEFYDGRNNLGVVSLNPAMYAVEANGDVDKFWEILQKNIELAHEALKFRLASIGKVQAKSAPMLYMEGALLRLDAEEYVLPHLIRRGASISLGYVGLEEAANAMFGTEVHTLDSEVKTAFIAKILKVMAEYVAGWKESEGIGYTVYATPAEQLCNRFCKLIVSSHGEVAGVTDKGYLTNSFHLDVQKQTDPVTKILFESQFLSLTPGGFINYAEAPNMINNLDGLEALWDFSYKYVPYYGTNTPIDECYECGFNGEFNCTSDGFSCPSCGNGNPATSSVTRRVCGYLGQPDERPFNTGKQEEMIKRVKHVK